jgi:hypothetical protein
MVLGHLNINSLRNKFFEVYEILSDELIDVFGLSETKLDPSFMSSQFSIPDYTMHRADRNSHGGGILLYVKSTLPHRCRKDLNCPSDSGLETLVIEIKTRKEKMFVVLIYKPPNVSNEQCINQLSSLLDKCYMECKSVYIMGDMNINFNNLPCKMEQFMNQYGLTNLVKGPTCFKSPQNPSLIDVFLSNTPQRISSHLNISIGLSDFHNLICAATRIHAPFQVKRKITYRSFKKFDDINFNDDLEKVPFHVCDIFDDTDDVMWSYHYLLNEVVDIHAPSKTKFLKKPQLPYMNGQLRKAINVKAMLKRKFDKCNDKINWNKYRKQRNLVTSLKRKSIKEYFNQKCNEQTNGKQFWNTVRPFMTNSQTSGSNISLFEEGKMVTKPSQVCEILNNHFINIANDLSEPDDVVSKPVNTVIDFYKNHPSILNINAQCIADNDCKFNFSKVNSNDVFKIINKLKTGKACGYDKIPVRILKTGSAILSLSLMKIINRCIDDVTFPNHCKHAVVSAVYKKNDFLQKENYRPVSVLTALSKVIENIMCDQLMVYLNDVMSREISAYRRMYSTNNVIIKCCEEWKYALDNNKVVGCVAMDLSKAFDSIPHNLLIAKLNAYGLSFDACKFVSSYLSDRMQCVKLNDHYSEWQYVQRGGPQGSLMGPVLFNVYINDLILLLQNFCSIFNYADDNTLSFSHENINIVKKNLEMACELSIEWFGSNYMKVNAEKFQFMVLDAKHANTTLMINATEIKASHNMKLLGVNLDPNLCFDYHINEVICQASKQINVLCRLSQVLNLTCKLKILDAFVISNLSYCSLAYHHCKLVDARKLEMLFKRALRFVYLDFTSTYKELLCKADKSCLYVTRLRNMLLMVYKVLNGNCPPIKKDFFEVQEMHYNLRC